MSALKTQTDSGSNHSKKTLKEALESIDETRLSEEDINSQKICCVINYLKEKVTRSPKEPPPNNSKLAWVIRLTFWAFVIVVGEGLVLNAFWYFTGDTGQWDWAILFLFSAATLLIIIAPVYLLGSVVYKMLSSEYAEREGFIHRVRHNTNYALVLRDSCDDALLKQVATYLKWQIDTQADLNSHTSEFIRGASVLYLGMLVAMGLSPEALEFKKDIALMSGLAVLFVLFVRGIVTSRLIKLRLWLSMLDQASSIQATKSKELVENKPEAHPSFLKRVRAFLRLS